MIIYRLGEKNGDWSTAGLQDFDLGKQAQLLGTLTYYRQYNNNHNINNNNNVNNNNDDNNETCIIIMMMIITILIMMIRFPGTSKS